MVDVKKRDESIESFIESKIVSGVKKAGATAEEAEKVAKDIVIKVKNMTVIPAERVSDMVVKSLRNVNRKASDDFVKFRDKKLKAVKKG
ncbi:MAG: ATP cone domain-containing protein [Candidatus Aenigmarchaeota archaeon]|nr:ATP cone domain-containing protein [Candidatus Aenigmarchaeota archaeon]